MQKIIVRKPTEGNGWDVKDLHPLLRRIYLNRGIKSSSELEYGTEHLLSYENLCGIDAAITCLWQALKKQQHILIIGDYDADGATSTALAVKTLKAFGYQQVSYLVPNRFKYGYGLTPEIAITAARSNPDLIITVDNGISSCEGVAMATQLGSKVLITDHHLPSENLPEADAIVNPNQHGDKFESKNLAGVGVIFYVMLALRKFLRDQEWFTTQEIPEPNMASFLDLVALGTVADIVNLDKNNRILVQQGLCRIRAGKCCAGIKALLQIAKRNYKRTIASDLGYVLGPRLNAAGRLDDMSLGIECLLEDDANKALEIARQLNTLNNERRVIEVDMHQQAARELNNLQLDKELPIGLCLYDANWHQGVIGILASRIKDRLHRPVIAFAKVDDNEIKGSARSISGLHIRDVLNAVAAQNPELINKFGGHAMAAGLSLQLDKYNDFCAAFDQEVSKYLSPENLDKQIYVDGELTEEELCLDTAKLLRDAGPWGQGFPEPIFVGTFNIVQQYLVGNKHLKLMLNLPDNSQTIEAIAFNIDSDKWPNYQCNRICIAYRLDVNEYRSVSNLQLIIEYLEAV
ncbi:MAG: ssDNA exonuclease RecJ [Coxiella sp. DG_40]|nr:MAG: ssDNA exonuclease RecJ [Coxiella sp. DG_40]